MYTSPDRSGNPADFFREIETDSGTKVDEKQKRSAPNCFNSD
jgi:hypothetical protein